MTDDERPFDDRDLLRLLLEIIRRLGPPAFNPHTAHILVDFLRHNRVSDENIDWGELRLPPGRTLNESRSALASRLNAHWGRPPPAPSPESTLRHASTQQQSALRSLAPKPDQPNSHAAPRPAEPAKRKVGRPRKHPETSSGAAGGKPKAMQAQPHHSHTDTDAHTLAQSQASPDGPPRKKPRQDDAATPGLGTPQVLSPAATPGLSRISTLESDGPASRRLSLVPSTASSYTAPASAWLATSQAQATPAGSRAGGAYPPQESQPASSSEPRVGTATTSTQPRHSGHAGQGSWPAHEHGPFPPPYPQPPHQTSQHHAPGYASAQAQQYSPPPTRFTPVSHRSPVAWPFQPAPSQQHSPAHAPPPQPHHSSLPPPSPHAPLQLPPLMPPRATTPYQPPAGPVGSERRHMGGPESPAAAAASAAAGAAARDVLPMHQRSDGSEHNPPRPPPRYGELYSQHGRYGESQQQHQHPRHSYEQWRVRGEREPHDSYNPHNPHKGDGTPGGEASPGNRVERDRRRDHDAMEH